MKFIYLFFLSSFCLISLNDLSAQGKALPMVTVQKAVEIALCAEIEALGTTLPNEMVSITANTSEKIQEVLFEDGQSVQAGDTLIKLEKNEEEAELKALEALLIEKKPAFERARVLVKRDVAAKSALQQREATLRELEADISVIKARIADRVIKAPFSGKLGFRQMSVGALVQPGDLITTLIDTNKIKVDFDVPAKFLSILKKGLEIKGKVEALPDRIFFGTVSVVNPQVDPTTRTIGVRAVLPNEKGLLKPGLLMTINIRANKKQVLVIPEESVKQKGSNHFVHSVKTDSKSGQKIAELRKVSLGVRKPGLVEVTSGLNKGESVVERGNLPLVSKTPVQLSKAKIHKPLDYSLFKCEVGK